MIEFDQEGAEAYARKQLKTGANVILPPPPFNCRVGYQERLEIQSDGIMVSRACRFAYDTSYGQRFYSWEDIGWWISTGSKAEDRSTVGRVIRLYQAKCGGKV